MGSADFGIPSLDLLVQKGYDIIQIVSTPPKPQGRGLKLIDSPVAQYAAKQKIAPILIPQSLSHPEFLSKLKDIQADLFIVIAFRILPPEVFKIPRLGAINVHASLLPKFRGPAPIQRCLEAGEKKTGITIFQIDEGIDTGNIILQKSLAIDEHETAPQLYTRLSALGADAVHEACQIIQKGNFTYLDQKPQQVSRAPKLKKSESLIQWNQPAKNIFNKIRAFNPFPGTHFLLKQKRIGLSWALPSNISSTMTPGSVCEKSDDWFAVQCEQSSLRILKVKPAGKKEMSTRDFLNGTHIEIGMKLE